MLYHHDFAEPTIGKKKHNYPNIAIEPKFRSIYTYHLPLAFNPVLSSPLNMYSILNYHHYLVQFLSYSILSSLLNQIINYL